MLWIDLLVDLLMIGSHKARSCFRHCGKAWPIESTDPECTTYWTSHWKQRVAWTWSTERGWWVYSSGPDWIWRSWKRNSFWWSWYRLHSWFATKTQGIFTLCWESWKIRSEGWQSRFHYPSCGRKSLEGLGEQLGRRFRESGCFI